MATLTLIRGLPGSGKSTLAEQIQNFHGDRAMEVCADYYHTDEDGKYRFDPRKVKDGHEWCLSEAIEGMRMGVHVIVHNTFTQRWEMAPYVAAAKSYGYVIQEIVCKGDFGSVHNVPTEVINRMRERWED